MTYREDLAPPRVRPRAAFLPFLAGFLLLAGALALPAAAQAPPGADRPGPPAIPGNDRAAIRFEAELARSLARLDEELGLQSYPDVSPLWPARMAAAIEARDPGAPAQTLLLRLATELRRLGAEVPFGGPPGEGRVELPAHWQAHPSVASPAGRERAERVARIHGLVDLVGQKLDLGGRTANRPANAEPESGRVASRLYVGSSGDDCGSPADVGLGYHSGYTSHATNDGSSSCEGPTASPDVWLRFTAPEDGTYTFRTVDPGYRFFDTVLSLHSGCPVAGDDRELTCSDDIGPSLLSSVSRTMSEGETVLVRIAGYGGASGDYDLVIELGRKIEGTVTRETDGAPLEGMTVEMWSYWDDLLGTAVSRADGSYTAEVPSLEAGEVYALASGSGYLPEVYENLDCAFYVYCRPYYGTRLDASASDLAGVDFTLEPGGTVSGSVRSVEDGAGLDGYVYLYGADGVLIESVWHDDESGGAFEIENVPAGDYYVHAQGYGHRSETWDDVPCDEPCDPTTGTLVTVSTASPATDLDFVLDRLGAIEGTVTLEGSEEPVADLRVSLYDTSGSFFFGTYTLSDGSYRFSAVPQEYFHVRTFGFRYEDELYDDLPCEPSCDPTTGTRVRALIGQTRSGVDFTLVEKPSISGTVTAAATGEPLARYVRLYDTSGGQWGTVSTDPDTGAYSFYGLEPGTYHVLATTTTSFYEPDGFEPQLYEGIFCDGCDVTTGTPVALAADAHVTGIDFELTPRGSITGRVTDLVSGAPLEGLVRVRAYSPSGEAVGNSVPVASDGSYEIFDLVRGEYRVGTVSDIYVDDHQDEMWNDIPCPYPCDRSTGQAVTVLSGQATTGVDFALHRLGRISGRLYSSKTGHSIRGFMTLLDASGQELRYANSYTGSYDFSHVRPGTYYVLAEEDSDDGDLQQEVYPDVPCDPDCDPTLGTPIVVTYGSEHTGIDFHLTYCPAPSFGEVVSTTVSTYLKILACETVTARDATLESGGNLLIRAGSRVVFGDGFSIEPGAKLQVFIEPDWSDQNAD